MRAPLGSIASLALVVWLAGCSRGPRAGSGAPHDAGAASPTTAAALPLTPHADDDAYRGEVASLLSSLLPDMPDDRFWALVAEIDWGQHAAADAIDALGDRLRARATIEDVFSAHGAALAHALRLQRRLEIWERDHDAHVELGDDAFGDLCAHIVGLGRAEVERVTADPSLARTRAQKHDFVESFLYVFQRAERGYSIAELLSAARTHTPVVAWDGSGPPPANARLVSHEIEGLGVVTRKNGTITVVFPRGELRITDRDTR